MVVARMRLGRLALRFNYWLCRRSARAAQQELHDGCSLVQGSDDGGGDAQTLSTSSVGIMAHIDAGKTT